MVDNQSEFVAKLSSLLTCYALEVKNNPQITSKEYLFDSSIIDEIISSQDIDDADKVLIATAFDIYARTNCDLQTRIIIKNNIIRMIKEALRPIKGIEFGLRRKGE